MTETDGGTVVHLVARLGLAARFDCLLAKPPTLERLTRLD